MSVLLQMANPGRFLRLDFPSGIRFKADPPPTVSQQSVEQSGLFSYTNVHGQGFSTVTELLRSVSGNILRDVRYSGNERVFAVVFDPKLNQTVDNLRVFICRWMAI